MSRRTLRTSLLSLISFVLVSCSIEPPTETNPEKYSSLLTEWAPTRLIAHFPNPLPPTATKIKLSAFPGFLQGGAWFQVRLTLPAAEVAKVYEDATKSAKDFYDGGDFFTSTHAKDGGLPGTGFHTADPGQAGFPKDYRIFVFDAQSSGGNTWNHGQSHGVVVSKQRNEIIYFAEKW